MEEKKEQKNIYQKMLMATEKIETVKKELTVGKGQNQYKAVAEKEVLEAVKPIEIELGIYSYPYSRKVIDTNILTTTSEYNGDVKEKNQLFMRLETIYRFINVDNPSEFMDVTTYGDGVDSQDKAPGKAMTYADKYALLKAYKIETGDDPDKEASGHLKKVAITNTGKASEKQVKMMEDLKVNIEAVKKVYGVDKFEDLTIGQASEIISKKKEGK